MNENKFNYTYSAPTELEKKEIESIKRFYEPKSERELMLHRLHSLDSRVKSLPQIIALCIGIFGTLVFGLGLTMVILWKLTVVGIIVMALGLPVLLLAYPVHNFVLSEYKMKYGDEILKLSNELLEDR